MGLRVPTMAHQGDRSASHGLKEQLIPRCFEILDIECHEGRWQKPVPETGVPSKRRVIVH